MYTSAAPNMVWTVSCSAGLQVVRELLAVLAVDVELGTLPVAGAVLVQVDEQVRAVVLVLDQWHDARQEDLPRWLRRVHPSQASAHEEDGMLRDAEEDLGGEEEKK